MIRIWRLSEAGDGNLGVACTKDGLALGRTPLIERQGHHFIVRERSEIERLLRRAYRKEVSVEFLLPGLATVAAALNAKDLCLAAMAAVHLRIPDLPDHASRDGIEAEDAVIKYARDEGGSSDWNPALHPRTGTPPNPGWFAPTDGYGSESSPVRTAQNDDPTWRSDASSSSGSDWARLPPGDYIDELHDFLEWLANAKPEEENAIRAEIKRYYYDVGDILGGDALNRALSNILDPGFDPKLHPDLDKDWRQTVLDNFADYAKADPSEIGLLHGSLPGFVLSLPGVAADMLETTQPASEAEPTDEVLEAPPIAADAAISPWELGWAKRGRAIHDLLSDGSLGRNFPTIDMISPSGTVTSIKSIDLNAAVYQNEGSLMYRLGDYVGRMADFDGDRLGDDIVTSNEITGRALQLVIPKGSMTDAQRIVLEAVRAWARTLNRPVDLVITEL